MASRNLAIANAVKTALNAAGTPTLKVAVTSVLRFAPALDLKDLTTRSVQVIPAGFEIDRQTEGSRGMSPRKYGVDVFIIQKLTSTSGQPDETEADVNLELLEDVSYFLEAASQASMSGAKFTGEIGMAELPEPLAEASMRDSFLFVAGIRANYLEFNTIGA